MAVAEEAEEAMAVAEAEAEAEEAGRLQCSCEANSCSSCSSCEANSCKENRDRRLSQYLHNDISSYRNYYSLINGIIPIISSSSASLP
jgi:hypothetical protein